MCVENGWMKEIESHTEDILLNLLSTALYEARSLQ